MNAASVSRWTAAAAGCDVARVTSGPGSGLDLGRRMPTIDVDLAVPRGVTVGAVAGAVAGEVGGGVVAANA